ncbi:sugar ABC transporter ATP-binding protein [Gilliamella apis]|uniref:D-xylose ABC transporter ATP-binding protein n=1 Tax=Gilliamella apis TaxID=1970738 RepID=A0A2V4E1M7_9GAMM|nr:sugar ABC transporter ATP-binding protein [Gilliamella apis]PXY91982.1 D-xylose ABC transporter ATP-binding protein [Gilliamella apis]WLS93004.1 sugar ABC transporter ATP-binding protein [Gilliamella apis]
MNNIILSVDSIAKNFGPIQALKNVSLDIYQGRVHTLLGENGAGKSTLMKILAGIYPPSSGTITYQGNVITIKNPTESRKIGIAIVFQELSLSNNLTIAQNIYANNEPNKYGIISDNQMIKNCNALFAEYGIKLNPTQIVGTMSMAQRQLVEIAKALSYDAKVLIMDEPTSSLSDNEAELLFNIIEKLKQKDVAIIYISHRMDEIMRISDDISVMRDGEYIATHQKTETTIDQLIAEMVGREVQNIYPPKLPHQIQEDPPLLEVRNLDHFREFKNISFKVHSGEVVGFFGLVGAGRSEVMKALFGVTKYQGEIFISGKKVNINSPTQAIEHGLAFVTENRKEEGLVLMHDVHSNINHIAFQYEPSFIINNRKELLNSTKYIKKMAIKTNNPFQVTGSLSGGNQQKIVIAKWLVKPPKILILDEPTRGIDIGAKLEIYKLIRELSSKGTAIIMISSELPEVMSISDRLFVMRNKKIVKEFNTEGLTQPEVMNIATGACA